MNNWDMQYVPTSNKIDLTTWGLVDINWLGKKIMRTVTETIREQFTKNPPSLHLPIEWSFGKNPSDGWDGPPVTDPATLYVALPLAESDDTHCCFACSLEGPIDGLIDGHKDCKTGKINGKDAIKICQSLAARLRELANKLEQACGET